VRNLTGIIRQDDETVLTELNIMLIEIPSPQTGEVYHSGLFNAPSGRPIKSGSYRLFLSDSRKAEILIKSCILTGKKRTVFFSIIGEFN
jgi:hypothetical protein